MSLGPTPSRVQAILDEAQGIGREQLPEFLDGACAGDATLRGEVESLLGALRRAGGFLAPGSRPRASARVEAPEPVLTGRVIGPFTIGERIGIGGMGVVYKARDTRLERTVALKVIRESLVHDPDRRERLEREARSLASLNHPNIGAIHSLEEFSPDDGAWVLVLEFVAGPTLADTLADGPMPVDEALRVAEQVARALEAAHARGIIHRDLKPGNIKITPDGVVKVLDFGLAKELGPVLARTGSSGLTEGRGTPVTPRERAMMTQEGLILGTPAYMSPEQARGRPVDRRSDLWAFGCVLYEMLAGAPAFGGETITDTIAAILRGEPDWSRLPGSTPEAARRLLRRCLEKDPERRLRDAGDARLDLEDGLTGEGQVVRAGTAGWRGSAVAGLVAAAVLVGAGLGIWSVQRGRASAAGGGAVRMSVDVPQAWGLEGDTVGGCVAVSPDGRTVAFVASSASSPRRLFVRNLATFETRELAGTLGAEGPCFSPDGKWIAYGDRIGPGEIRKIRVSGGSSVAVAPAPGSSGLGMYWCDDDTILFCNSSPSGIGRVPASGGVPTAVTILDPALHDYSHTQVEALPGGRTVLFTCLRSESDRFRFSIEAVDAATGRRRRVVDDACHPRYLPGGHLLYFQLGALFSVPFDAEKMAVAGEPRTVLAPLAGSEFIPRPRYAVSRTGTLAYLPATTTYEATELAWVSLDGTVTSECRTVGVIDSQRLSPDGGRVAYAAGTVMSDIWVRDVARATTTRITSGAIRFYPVWSPDGRRVAFQNHSEGRIEWCAADGTSEPEMIFTPPPGQKFYPNAFTPDGGTLVFTMTSSPEGPDDLYAVRIGGDGTARRVFGTPAYASRYGARLSPDGSLIAYTSEESGGREVWLQTFPALDRKIPISSGGGFRSAWSGDGRTLYYRSQDRLYAVEVSTSPDLAVSRPRLVLEHLPESRYDAAPDGTRFIVAQSPGGTVPPMRIHVVLNWVEEAGLGAAKPGR